jgi:hypothetical protein
MNIRNIKSLLPRLGLSVAHRSTREWRFGGSTGRDDNGLPRRLGRVAGLAAGLALGAGLTLWLSPETRATARRALEDAFPSRRAPIAGGRPTNGSTDPAAPHHVVPRNTVSSDTEDADACDAS